MRNRDVDRPLCSVLPKRSWLGGWALAVALNAIAQGQIPADQPQWDQWTTRVSVDSSGGQGNDDSELWANQSISGNGRYVVFLSYASNLVPGDTNRVQDIFVHDRLTGETVRVSVDSAGNQANDFSGTPCISADGRFVAWDTDASNLVSGDTNGMSDVFVHDLLTGRTVRVSISSSGAEANEQSWRPALSGDGRFVAFISLASNLVPGDTNGKEDVFVHDCLTGETTRVSVDSAGREGDGDSGYYFSPSISQDGRIVAFPSLATNLVPGDTNGDLDVFAHDRLTGETTRVSVSSTGDEADGPSWFPSVSGDGRYIAFMSAASNLVVGDANNTRDVFVRDRLRGTTMLVSVNSSGEQANNASGNPAISADGRYVAFESGATNLGGYPFGSDIFVHDRLTGKTRFVSVNHDGVGEITGGWSVFPSISADGRYVAFEGEQPGPVRGDTNRDSDVFVRGPELTLEAEPSAASPGDILTLTEYKGLPGNPVSLWVVRVNGTGTFTLVAADDFGSDGNFVVSGVVPPDLGGSAVTFRGYALGRSGLVIRTNDATVFLQ